MSEYISEKLDINYSVPEGLIFLLCGITGKKNKDVWCDLSDIANICAQRLLKKQNKPHSWTIKKFPETDIELRIDMFRNAKTFNCEIKFGQIKYQKFTQQQVNEYLTESVLLGEEDVGK